MSNANENNKRAQAEATNARNLNKMAWTSGWSQILIGVLVVLVTVVVVTVGKPNFFWTLVTGAFAMWIGGSLEKIESDVMKKALGPWPKIIGVMGLLTIVGVLIFASGFGKIFESSVMSVDQKLTCVADSDAEGCEEAAKTKAAEANGYDEFGCLIGSWNGMGRSYDGEGSTVTKPKCVCVDTTGQDTITVQKGYELVIKLRSHQTLSNQANFLPFAGNSLKTENFLMVMKTGNEPWVIGSPSPYMTQIRIKADGAQYKASRIPFGTCLIYDFYEKRK